MEQHYQFSGYISGYDPADVADRAAIRAGLGYRQEDGAARAAARLAELI